MKHPTRWGIFWTVMGLAFYVTGLQKKLVISPFFKWFSGLDVGVQLLLLAALLGAVAALLALRRRRRLAALRSAIAVVAANTARA